MLPDINRMLGLCFILVSYEETKGNVTSYDMVHMFVNQKNTRKYFNYVTQQNYFNLLSPLIESHNYNQSCFICCNVIL